MYKFFRKKNKMGQQVRQNTPGSTTYGRDSNGNAFSQGSLQTTPSSQRTTLNGVNPSSVPPGVPGANAPQNQSVRNGVIDVNVDQRGNYATNSSTELKENPNAPQRTLESNPYKPQYYRYPLDLETNKKKGHLVRFGIYETKPSELFKFTGKTVMENLNQASDRVPEVIEKVKNIYETGRLENVNLKKSSTASIELYIPDNINFSYNSQYDDISVTDSLVKAFSGIGTRNISLGSVVASITTGDIARVAAQSLAGIALNPQQQLLFQGTNFRQYQMAFVFTPRSQKEADEIAKIVKTFKKHALPTIVENTAGFIYRPPSTFEISFYSNGYENTKINKIATSVLENVDVNYTPNGWTTHTDGNPVQTILTLSFKETVVLDSKKIDEGY